ncbi:MAG: hypothetical protein KAJ78_06420, partial [Acidobacteria bacterium]|nr:hypothetical protein [Acidobacteriota bacterium]
MKHDRQTGRSRPLLRMKKTAIIFAALVPVMVAWNLTVAYVDTELQDKEHQGVYDSCHKIWAARGLYNSLAEQNSIESMRRAFDHGAHGAEVDLHYDVRMNLFIISHDHPIEDKNGNLIYELKNGRLLTLEELLEAVGAGHFFWLDYKNLDHLTVEE